MSPRGRAWLSGLAVILLFALPLLPEILGTRRLIFRDAQITHWPWRRVAMASLSAGEVPFVNASASGGQPFLANPNAVLLYPTLLLERVLPPASAFNLHYLLHVLWAFFGGRALARRLGLSAEASFVAGVAFAFSGMMLSYGSAFMNSAAAAAWLPWCAAAAMDLARARSVASAARGAAATALAFGLQLLAGEPALSLLTGVVAAALALPEVLARPERRTRWKRALPAAAAAALLSGALAAPLLLPLSQVLPLTYRGQHLFSERAFGASSFALWRLPEWLFPRWTGDPGALAAGAHWQYALHPDEILYIWRVTFGVIPLILVALAAVRREFWSRRVIALAAGAVVSLLFAAGTALPFARWLYQIEALRRLRYPIKFYLITTLCVALLAGAAVERLRAARPGRREWLVAAIALFLFAAGLVISLPGGLLDDSVAPRLAALATPAQALLPAIRRAFRADALLGMLAVAVVVLTLLIRPGRRGYLLGAATLVTALPWGLPLFVSAPEKNLARPPALLRALSGSGRLYVSPRLPEFNLLASGTAHPDLPPSVSKLARVQIEELIPATGSAFGVDYLFDSDPDGSYGYYNRLASEALTTSNPDERSRLLRTYSGRWILSDAEEDYPGARTWTGLLVAGRHLRLHELGGPLPELRWAGRAHRRSSLSGALDLIRSDRIQRSTDVVLPGRHDFDASGTPSRARLTVDLLRPDRAEVRIEADGPGHVLFSRTYFSAWKASRDGRTVPVLVANARDLAVEASAGTHHIRLWYDRGPFHRGVALQAGGLLLLLAVALLARR